MNKIDDEMKKEFLWTAKEDLGYMENALLKLEAEAGVELIKLNPKIITELYRRFHSLKGAAGVIQLPTLEQVSHECENILSHYQADSELVRQIGIDALLSGIDQLKLIVANIEDEGEEGILDIEPFLKAVSAVTQAELHMTAKGAEGLESFQETTPHTVTPDDPVEDTKPEEISSQGGEAWDIEDQKPPMQTPTTQNPPSEGGEAWDSGPEATVSHGRANMENTSAAPIPPAKSNPPTAKPANIRKQTATPIDSPASPRADASIRVDIALLDRLMNLVGELVLARNQLLQTVDRYDDHNLTASSQLINQVTSSVQENIMQTRMQPVSNIFNKFPRIVRDLSKELNKKIKLELHGNETELDRTIIEAMRDPFTHLLRNCIDHGIEPPEVRKAQGKPVQGTIAVKAYHEGGQVIVEVQDDGGGIDPEKVKQKAISHGLLSVDDAVSLSDKDALSLICAPGLSTAKKVTNVSGRGVGMDVVKSNIINIGGSLEIQSVLQVSTTIRIKIPLTLAIIPALMVGANGGMYGVPQVNLVELVGVDLSESDVTEDTVLETVSGAKMYRLRERLLTVLHLDDILELKKNLSEEDDTTAPDLEKKEQEMLFIVVVAAGEQQFGIVVDEIYDTEEIVVKPLSSHINHIDQFAGATIRGDGNVVAILDIAGIARLCNITQTEEQEAVNADEAVAIDEDCEFLVFDLAPEERFAIALSLVSRIEQYEGRHLTLVNGKTVVCENKKLLPVIELQNHLNTEGAQFEDDDLLFAIIIAMRGTGKEVGIVAKNLEDITAVPSGDILNGDQIDEQGKILGVTVIDNRPTAIIDIHRLLDPPGQTSYRETSMEHRQPTRLGITAPAASPPPIRILYAEDAPFFQNVISGYIRDAGCSIQVESDGKAALECLLADKKGFDIIFTDLEMPVMDGWTFIREIRSHPQYDETPVIALSSLTTVEAREKAMKFGATDYLVKLNRDEMLDVINRYVNQLSEVS